MPCLCLSGVCGFSTPGMRRQTPHRTHDDYPLDECLRVCLEQSATTTSSNNSSNSKGGSLLLLDATAFLLERTGDVSGALRMLVAAVEERAGALQAVLARLDAREFAAFVASLQGQGQGKGGGGAAGMGAGALTPGQLRRKGLIRKVGEAALVRSTITHSGSLRLAPSLPPPLSYSNHHHHTTPHHTTPHRWCWTASRRGKSCAGFSSPPSTSASATPSSPPPPPPAPAPGPPRPTP